VADDGSGTTMSWWRAALEAADILAAGFGLLVVGTDLIVTRVTGLDRHGRVGLATVWFVLALSLLAWLMRRLQARHLV